MYGPNVLDKDGVSAAAVFAEMASEIAPITVSEQLDMIYRKYGYHVCNNSYYISHDVSKTNEMFTLIQQNYPKSLGDYEIADIRDMNTGYDSREPDLKSKLPLQSSHMITFYFKNGATVTLRTSGTEPKIKWYSEMVADTSEAVQTQLEKLVELIKSEWYQPERFGFLPKPEI